ncbi:MAG: hypothetical protein NE327_06560 [Lentisphaeraceae bacterium]|nr:hypothetical protein [Lentisphaeraceae bacterium]
MKLYCIYVFMASMMLSSVLSLRANQKDDVFLVNKLLELYPKIDLSKEALLQTELIGDKYGKEVASILMGKISYKTNQKSLARKSFTDVPPNSQYYTESILTYYLSAKDESVNDTSGVKEASELFVHNKLWDRIEDRDSEEWAAVESIFKSYADFFKNDRAKIEQLKGILNELNIVLDFDGELKSLIAEVEKSFYNDWSAEAGIVENTKKLEAVLAKLEELEFGEKSYEFFTAFTSRARVLVLLGKYEQALELLESTKSKIIEYDGLLKEHLEKDKTLSKDQRGQALSQMSVLSSWYYAKALASFQKYRVEYKKSGKEAGELLYGRFGPAVNFFLCAKKFPENEFSYKSILAYQKLRGIISQQYSKNLKELSVSALIQGKAFYIAKDFENAFKYLLQALNDKDEDNAYEAYNLAIGTAVKLSKLEDADNLFSQMIEKYSSLNKAPKNYISRLVNYLSATHMQMAAKVESKDEKLQLLNRAKGIFEVAKSHGSTKANVSMKYLLVNKFLNMASKYKNEQAKKVLTDIQPLLNSLLTEHKLSKESVKVLRTLGLTHQKMGNDTEAIEFIAKYLKKVKGFSTKVTEDQVKMRMMLVELLINKSEFNKADDNLRVLSDFKGEFKENISALQVRLQHAKYLKNQNPELKKDYTENAEKFISKFKESKSRPFIIAQLALVYQTSNETKQANKLYAILQSEYPEHEVNNGTEINQVLALLKEGQEEKALESLSKSEDLKTISQSNLYAILVKVYDSFMGEDLSKEHAEQLLTVLSAVNSETLKSEHMQQKTVLIKSDALISLKKYDTAEKELTKVLEKYPQNSYVVELNLKLGKCLAGIGDFQKLSKVYNSLQNLIRRTNGGAGDYSLNVKISADFAEYFSKSQDEKFLNKGKYIAFLASQFNEQVLDKKDHFSLEKSHFWNAWYSNKLAKDDFQDLKKSFLMKYPSSKYAPELRKL